MQGKGHVVRRMFADVDADIYVMADGDATYDAAAAPALVAAPARRAARHGGRRARVRGRGGLSARPPVRQRAADRHARAAVRAQLHRHLVGLSRLFAPLREELSGAVARASRSRPRSASTRSNCKMPVAEVDDAPMARGRRARSRSSRTYRDGWRILRTILQLCSGSSGRCCSSAAIGAAARVAGADPRHAAGDHLSPDRPGAALPDRDPGRPA